jgi:broad-specificity NMP kinase
MLGVTWHEFFDYVLAVNGQSASDAFIAWQAPEVYSDKESWDTAVVQQSAGVSQEQTLRERGYSEEQIADFTRAVEIVTATPASQAPPTEVA